VSRSLKVVLLVLGAVSIAGGLAAWRLASAESEIADPETVVAPTAGGGEPEVATPSPVPGAVVDPLCPLHDARIAVLAPIGDVDNPTELEAHVRAQVEFYRDAAGVVGEPDASAFRAMLGYYESVAAFHGARGWSPRVDISEAAQVPRVPGDAATAVAAALETRCGVTPPRDTTG
jgi:hypothetical protein